MRRKFLNVLILLMCLSIEAVAQKTFQEGFIITGQSDSTYGLIKYSAQKDQEASISFKITKKGEVKSLSVNEIEGFVLEGSRYYVVKDFLSLDPINRKIFVEVLIEGEISLYKGSTGFYLEKDGIMSYLALSPVLEGGLSLKEQLQLRNDNDRTNIIKMATVLTGGCNISLIDEYGFKNSDRSLLTLVKAYHECLGLEFIEFNNNTPWSSLEGVMVAGVNSSSYSFSDGNNNFDFINQADFEYFNSLVVGAELHIKIPRASRRLGFIIGAQYQKTDHYGFSTLRRSSTFTSYNDFLITTSLIRIPFGINYNISLGNWPVILSAGVNSNRYINFEYSRTEELLSSSQGGAVVLTKVYEDDISVQSNESGFWFGIGTRNKLTQKLDFGVQLRFENNDSFTNISSKTRNFQLLLSVIY